MKNQQTDEQKQNRRQLNNDPKPTPKPINKIDSEEVAEQVYLFAEIIIELLLKEQNEKV